MPAAPNHAAHPVALAYTATQRRQLKEDFAPVLARYHRLKKLTSWVIIGLFASFFLPFLAGLLPDTLLTNWLSSSVSALFFVAFAAVFILGFRMRALLKCPGCTAALETLGPHCPECGHAGLVPAVHRWFSSTPAHCAACGRDLAFRSTGKGGSVRTYTIRACSSCGLLLDDAGV